MNLCTACGKDFGSVSGFDDHRVGKYPQTGPANYLDRVRAGLTTNEWAPEEGRRCLDDDELAAKGWAQDQYGRWRQPVREKSSVSFTALRSRPRRA